MNTDILCKISHRLTNDSVANLSIASGENTMIIERKKAEYERILADKMHKFWFGRLTTYMCVYEQTSFWDGRPLSINDHVRHRVASFFRGWHAYVCGAKIHFSTRVLDDVIAITVDTRCPYHSLKSGDPVMFKFDIVHTTIPLDVDSYKPVGKYNRPLVAMYECLVKKSEQFGIYDSSNGVTLWDKTVSIDDMGLVYEKTLGDDWIRMDENYPENVQSWYHIWNHYDDRRRINRNYYMKNFDWSVMPRESEPARMRTIGFFGLYIETPYAQTKLYPSCSSIVPDGSFPSTDYGYQGDMDRKLFNALGELHKYGPIRSYSFAMSYYIDIKIHGKRHRFFSWKELSRTSKIRMEHLKRKMSVPNNETRGVFIDFDSQTFKRKKISFEC